METLNVFLPPQFEGQMRFPTLFRHPKAKRHPEVAQVLDLFGRRDWIRTNDPHHVKVVL
jgi:hypothetical protein